MPILTIRTDSGKTIQVRTDEAGGVSNSAPSSPKKILGLDPQTISTVARPTLEGLGALGGGVLGEALGPEGAVAGGMGGYGIAREAANLLDQKLGLRKPLSNAGDVAHTLKQDLMGGAENEIAGGALQGLQRMGGRALEKVFPGVQKGSDAAIRFQNAKAQGMPVTPSDVHQTKGLAQLEFFLNRYPLSASQMEKFHNGQEDQAQFLRDHLLKNSAKDPTDAGKELQALLSAPSAQAARNIADKMAVKGSAQDLGEKGKTGLAEKSKQMRDVASKLYNEVGTELQGGMHEPTGMGGTIDSHLGQLKNIPNADKSLLAYLQNLKNVPLRMKDGSQIPEDIKAYLADEANPSELKHTIIDQAGIQKGFTWPEMQGIRAGINDRIQSETAPKIQAGKGMAFHTTDSGRRLIEVKKGLEQDMADFASSHPEAAAKYDAANKLWGTGNKLFKNPVVTRSMNTDPEKLADHWIQPGNVSRIDRAMQSFGKSGFAPVRQQFALKLFGNKDGQSADSSLKALNKYGRPVIEKVFGKDRSDWLFDEAKKAQTNKFVSGATGKEPANLFSSLVSPGNVSNMAKRDSLNASNIGKVRAIAGDKGLANLKEQWLSQVLQPTKDGTYTAKMFSDKTTAYGPKTLQSLFPPKTIKKTVDGKMTEVKVPNAELKQIESLVKLGQTVKGGERIVSNPSGTSNAMGPVILMGEGSGAIGALAAGHPLGAAGIIGASVLPAGLAKIYLSPAGRRLMLEGYHTPIGKFGVKGHTQDPQRAVRIAGQLLSIAGLKNIVPIGKDKQP